MNQTPLLTPPTPFKWTLLYYHYFSQKISIEARAALQEMLQTSAQRNNLVGRIRVAFDGINATLGAYSKSDLEKHANEISSLHGEFSFNTENTFIDFKYALSEGSRSIEAIEGCRFNTFEAKLVDEIVTMNLAKERANPINTGIHLSPTEFHNGIILDSSDTTSNIIKADVIIDVRNSYESDIGRFVPPSNVSLLVPNVRTFADMPSYFDSIEKFIKGKNIFMYCTGGVRCERASAYIREKGEGFKNVYQLQGGVQRYLEAAERGDLVTPPIAKNTGDLIDSSLWAGRLFVFDERRPVRLAGACPPPLSYRPSARILSTCILCKKPWDEYEWLRCGQCSILVLVCDTCIQNGTTATIDDRSRLRCSTCSTLGDSIIKRRSSNASTEKPSIEELQKRKEEREQRGAERRAKLNIINNASSSSLFSSFSMSLVADTGKPLFIGLFDDDDNDDD